MRTIHRNIVGLFLFSNDNHFLLGKGGVYKGEWIVPGGGIEEGETKLEAIRRETLEEVGIDIKDFEVKAIDKVFTGESEKVLRDTGEKVLVKMTFYDFLVRADKPARDIPIKCNDDIVEAKWHQVSDLHKIKMSAPTKTILELLGYM